MRKKILNFADYINEQEQESIDLTELLIGTKEDIENKIVNYTPERFIKSFNASPSNIKTSILTKLDELNIKYDTYGWPYASSDDPKLQTILNLPASIW